VSQYQKGKTTNQSGFTGARDSEWHWHLLGHMQCLLALTSCKVSHSTYPQSSSLHGTVKARNLSR